MNSQCRITVWVKFLGKRDKNVADETTKQPSTFITDECSGKWPDSFVLK